jgi:hypothetical protein
MKRKDIMLIVIVVIFAGIVSLVISKIFFTSSGQRNLQAEVVQQISTDFEKPDPSVFNDQAINPTQLIQIGDSTNPQPF